MADIDNGGVLLKELKEEGGLKAMYSQPSRVRYGARVSSKEHGL